MDATCDGIKGSIYLSLPQTSQSQKVPIKLSQGLQKVSLPVMTFTEKDEIKPWWPHGYGKPNLYALKVKKPNNNQPIIIFCFTYVLVWKILTVQLI